MVAFVFCVITHVSLRCAGWEGASRSGQPAGFGTLVSTVALQINHHLTAYYDTILILHLDKQFYVRYEVTTESFLG